jgi:hypothetical protein
MVELGSAPLTSWLMWQGQLFIWSVDQWGLCQLGRQGWLLNSSFNQ